jgi:predicted HTH domain antitoxin
MTNHQIIELFHSTNITLAELARLSGRTVKELKILLMNSEIIYHY